MGGGDSFPHIQVHLDNLIVIRPLRGYCPDTTKRILFVYERNISWYQNFFWGRGLNIVTGS